jgi:thiol:disulfide interchange protein
MVLLYAIALIGCAVPPQEPELESVSKPDPHWIPRTDAELETALNASCEASLASHNPLLLEFSAPWCIDCRKLEALEEEPTLVREFDQWERLRIDVGRFDRHSALREAFGVHAIAHWVAVKPTQGCSGTADRWTRLKQSTIEIETGSSGPRTVGELVTWLKEARAER